MPHLKFHARRPYATTFRPEVAAANELAIHLRKGDLSSPFALREVYRPCWTGLDVEGAKLAVELLCELGWLREESVKTEGRPAVRYQVNPRILEAG